MSNTSSSASGGIGFFGLLTILFIGLKLTHFIEWSWWWVLSPLWIPLAILLTVGVLAFAWFMWADRPRYSRRRDDRIFRGR